MHLKLLIVRFTNKYLKHKDLNEYRLEEDQLWNKLLISSIVEGMSEIRTEENKSTIREKIYKLTNIFNEK